MEKIVWTLQYIVEKPESYYAQVLLFSKKKADQKSQPIVFVNYKLEEFIWLLELMNTVLDKVITKKHFCNVL